MAGVATDVIEAGPLVQTRVRGTLVYVHLAVIAFEPLLACTPVAIHQVITCSSILARVRKTLIFVHFAVDTNPACIAEALIAAETSSTVSMDAGTAQTLVHL